MFDYCQLLNANEREVGLYTLEIARETRSGWSPTVPPLSAVVTNNRLLLHPDTFKPYRPASIPGALIRSITRRDYGRYCGVCIRLSTGLELNFLVGWQQSDDFVERVKNTVRPPGLRGYRPTLPKETINRLIDFVKAI